MSEFSKAIASADATLDTEIKALQAFRAQISGQFEPALKILVNCKGHVVITGLGKSGLVGAKIAATFASTGTPSFFLHSADALHGDSGALTPDDVLIAISNS